MTTCTLCDLPFGGEAVTDPAVDGAFCCRGCLEVFRTFGAGGVEALEADRPAESPSATIPDDAATAFLDVDGMHCATCERFLEATASRHPGIYAAEASYATELMKVVYDPATRDESTLPGLVSGLGYHASFPDEDAERARDDRFEVDRIRAALGVIGAMAVMTFYVFFLYPTYLGLYPRSFLYESGTSLVVFVPIPLLATFVLGFVGFPILRGAYVSLRTGVPNMDLLVAFGATAAYAYSLLTLATGGRVVYFDVSTVVIAVVTVGNFVETSVKRRAVGALADVGSRGPDEARVRRDGRTTRVPIDEVRPGDVVLASPGERLPVDGRVVAGEASIDEAFITGESRPRTVGPGDRVVGGARVLAGDLTVEVGADATSTLDQLVSQLWGIESSGGTAQRLADRIAGVFVPAILALGAVVAVVDLALGEPIATAVTTGVAVLVVSCPCSFGLATPLAVAVGVRRAAADGVVVTNATTLERGATIDVIALDKTGTLSTRELRVGQVLVDEGAAIDESTLLARAAAIEAGVRHPIAEAIVEAAPSPESAAVSGVQVGARDVRGTVDGEPTVVGHPSTFEALGWTTPAAVQAAIEAVRGDGAIATVVGWDGVARGVIGVRDTLRPDWEATVNALAADGRTVVVLTGDDQSSVGPLEANPDVDLVFTGMLPQAKAATIERLRAEYGPVAMVGDGDNDAPALAAADLGIAIGTPGTLATEAADVTILDRDLDAIGDLVGLSRTVRRRVRQNFGWAFAYNAVAIPLAVAGLVNPLLAAVAMAASSLLVVANSTR